MTGHFLVETPQLDVSTCPKKGAFADHRVFRLILYNSTMNNSAIARS
jgi:hypothetical protein